MLTQMHPRKVEEYSSLRFPIGPLQVMDAEHTKTRSELVHKETAAKYTAAMVRMKQLEKKLKRTISKSK